VKKPISFWPASDARDIADELIPEHHPHLDGEAILYLFRSQHSEKHGKIQMARAKGVTGLNAYLANREDLDAENAEHESQAKTPPSSLRVVEIAHDVWTTLDAKQKVALVDHTLCQFGLEGMRSPDVEEFREIVERWGLWQPDLEQFGQAVQTALFDEPSPARTGKAVKKATQAARNFVHGMQRTIAKGGLDSMEITTVAEDGKGRRGVKITKDSVERIGS